MTTSRRRLLSGLCAAVSAGGLLTPRPIGVLAAPSGKAKRRVTLLLGFAEGSRADTIARDFVAVLAPRLASTDLVVSNLPGNAGRTMLAALGDAAADGLTIGWVITPVLSARIIDHNEPSLGQRIRLLGQVEREPVAFVSPSSDPVNSIQDIFQRSSDDADAVPLGTPPAGSPPHLATLRLQVLAQTQLNIVTFPSAAAARQAVLAGNVSAAALGLSEAISDVRDGNLSAIGIAARRRFGLLPDTPILDEAGIPLSAFIRRGIGVPVATPAETLAPLIEAIRGAAQDETFREQADAKGYYATWEEAQDWAARMATEHAALTKLWETNPWLSSSGG